MSLNMVFQNLMALERVAGGFYRQAERLCRGRDNPSADLFGRMEREERLHEQQIRLTRDLALASDALADEVPGALAQLISLTALLQARIRALEEAEPGTISPQDLLQEAQEMERGMEGSHGAACVTLRDPDLRALVENLHRGDAAHLESLARHLACVRGAGCG